MEMPQDATQILSGKQLTRYATYGNGSTLSLARQIGSVVTVATSQPGTILKMSVKVDGLENYGRMATPVGGFLGRGVTTPHDCQKHGCLCGRHGSSASLIN
jgi:hypothetical protein